MGQSATGVRANRTVGVLPAPLPDGVEVHRLHRNADARGALIEVFRESWDLGMAPVQWNLVRSEPGVLRGVHLHLRHTDYVVVASGAMWIALKDIRPSSPTCGMSRELDLSAEETPAVIIPPGVVHGFYFPEGGTFIQAVDSYWDNLDELECQWNDPGLGFNWGRMTGGPQMAPQLSPRDRDAGRLEELVRSWVASRSAPPSYG
jgi:dTDP-4-dehydrorhamnose 3,5-epimerase